MGRTHASLQTLRDADDDEVPDWPEEHRCRKCQAPVWRVRREDGEDIELDQRPVETHLVLGKIRVRDAGFYVDDPENAFVWKRASAWRLADPKFIHAVESDGEISNTWAWFANRVLLTAEDPGLCFSEHYHMCTKLDARTIRSLASSSSATRGPMVFTKQHDEALMAAAVSRRSWRWASEERALRGLKFRKPKQEELIAPGYFRSQEVQVAEKTARASTSASAAESVLRLPKDSRQQSLFG